MEMLIVVAIIAILVAVAIPMFTDSLERAREATDLANIRAAYAQAVTDYLANGCVIHVVTAKITQHTETWDYVTVPSYLGKLPPAVRDSTFTITVDIDGKVDITPTTAQSADQTPSTTRASTDINIDTDTDDGDDEWDFPIPDGQAPEAN